MAESMAKEGRVTSLLSISAKEEDLNDSKKRWTEIFLRSTAGKECLLVVARGGAEFFQYLIQQVKITIKWYLRLFPSQVWESEKCGNSLNYMFIADSRWDLADKVPFNLFHRLLFSYVYQGGIWCNHGPFSGRGPNESSGDWVKRRSNFKSLGSEGTNPVLYL